MAEAKAGTDFENKKQYKAFSCVFMSVVSHSLGPCASLEPLGGVRGGWRLTIFEFQTNVRKKPRPFSRMSWSSSERRRVRDASARAALGTSYFRGGQVQPAVGEPSRSSRAVFQRSQAVGLQHEELQVPSLKYLVYKMVSNTPKQPIFRCAA